MTNLNQNLKPQNDDQQVVKVEAKPIEVKKTDSPKVNNVRIDNIGSLTFNLFAQPLKERYAKHYKGNLIHLAVDIVLGLIVIILLGTLLNLYFFSRQKLLNLIDFQVTSSPTNLVNGQEAEFTVNYTNTTKETLTYVNLVFKKPESLHNPNYSLPDFDLKTNTLKIGELAPNAHGQFTVKGFLLGNYNEKQEFLAVMNYKNKYGQDRQEFFSQQFQLTDSVLQTKIELPKRIIATGPFVTKINLNNGSTLDFPQVKIKMTWPEVYTFDSTSAPKYLDQQTWQIAELPAGQTASTDFIGRAFIEQPQDINFIADVFVLYNDKEYLINHAQNSGLVDFAKINLAFNNQEKNHSIDPGGQSTYTLTYKNEENYPLKNLEVSLSLAGDYAQTPLIKVDRNDYAKLATLEPGQEGSVEITGKAKTTISFPEFKEGGYNLSAKIVLSYDDPQENNRVTIESKSITTLVNSRLSLSTTGIFYTSLGDQIGVGSIPPVVEEYTSYWIIIKLLNTNNQLKNLKITATVPNGVEFTNVYNVTDGNQIIFNESTRQIEWQLDTLPAFSGIFTPAPEARIQLAITPNANQVGTSPALLSQINGSATDVKTNAFVSATGKNITTAIFGEESLNKVSE